MLSKNEILLPDSANDFLNYMDVIKNRSRLTIKEYSTDLRTFFRFLKQNRGIVPKDMDFNEISIHDISEEIIKSVKLSDAYAFLSFCKNNRGNSATTRARKVSSLKAYFKYLTIQKGFFHESPLQHLDVPKTKKALPKYLSLEQSISMLDCVEGKNKERDYAILALFLNCGLRLSELVGLNYTSIKDDGSMRILGKGNKERIIYINDTCKDAINSYMSVRPKNGVKDKKALFLSNRSQRISPKTVQHIVYTYLKKSGLNDMGISAHKLRHTAATLMYRYGKVDVLLLKEILGHENLGTTEIYTHVVDEQLKKAIESNPLANLKSKNKKA